MPVPPPTVAGADEPGAEQEPDDAAEHLEADDLLGPELAGQAGVDELRCGCARGSCGGATPLEERQDPAGDRAARRGTGTAAARRSWNSSASSTSRSRLRRYSSASSGRPARRARWAMPKRTRAAPPHEQEERQDRAHQTSTLIMRKMRTMPIGDRDGTAPPSQTGPQPSNIGSR